MMAHAAARLTEFLHGASRLPALPQATLRLMNALNAPGSTTRDIAAIVAADPALAARLLKIANSPFYGRGGRVATIQNAVVVLGLKTIRSLALTVWTHTLRSRLVGAGEIAQLTPLLLHGLATAVIAGQLAARRQQSLTEDAYLAGLLHDIGRVALVAELGADYRTAILGPAQFERRPLHEQENAVLGFDHRALGAALLEAWALPRFVIDAVERHHDEIIAPENHFMTAAVALADGYAARLGYTLHKDAPRPAHENLGVFFGLGEANALAAFLDQCLMRFQAISAAIG